MELKHFLLKELLLSLMDLLIYLIMILKNPPYWNILEIWALESFKSVHILSLKAFLSFVFCLVVSNNSCGKSFPSNIFELILSVVPVLFLTAVFSFSSCASLNFTSTLLYLTIYTNYRTSAGQEKCIVLFLYCQLLQQLLEILIAELLSDQHLKLFIYLNQQQLVCNCLWKMHNPVNNQSYNHHHTLVILSRLHRAVLLCH